MTKKSKESRKQDEEKQYPQQINEDADAMEDEELPVRISVYTQQELAFSDIMRSIFGTLTEAYHDGMSRKAIRKASGVKKKTLRRIEKMDLDTPFGDVLRVLAATQKTLAVVPLNGIAANEAIEDTMSHLEEALNEASSSTEVLGPDVTTSDTEEQSLNEAP